MLSSVKDGRKWCVQCLVNNVHTEECVYLSSWHTLALFENVFFFKTSLVNLHHYNKIPLVKKTHQKPRRYRSYMPRDQLPGWTTFTYNSLPIPQLAIVYNVKYKQLKPRLPYGDTNSLCSPYMCHIYLAPSHIDVGTSILMCRFLLSVYICLCERNYETCH